MDSTISGAFVSVERWPPVRVQQKACKSAGVGEFSFRIDLLRFGLAWYAGPFVRRTRLQWNYRQTQVAGKTPLR
jgi:hypothetical protein